VRTGRNDVLRGIDPATLALVQQLDADRALVLGPGPAAVDCESGNRMPHTPACASLLPGTGANVTTTSVTADATDEPALFAAQHYVLWLRQHPDDNNPLSMSRLRSATVALPSGTRLEDLAASASTNQDDDGVVQVDVRGDLACVHVLDLIADRGGCYKHGRKVNDLDGYYTPKRFTPGYASTL